MTEEVDCSRGDVIAAAANPPEAADQFEATIVWMADDELIPGRGYWLKLGTQTVTAMIQQPKYEINVNTLEHLAAPTLDSTRSASPRSRPTAKSCSSLMRSKARAPTGRSAGSS